MLWNCSKTALKTALKLLWNCSEIAQFYHQTEVAGDPDWLNRLERVRCLVRPVLELVHADLLPRWVQWATRTVVGCSIWHHRPLSAPAPTPTIRGFALGAYRPTSLWSHVPQETGATYSRRDVVYAHTSAVPILNFSIWIVTFFD